MKETQISITNLHSYAELQLSYKFNLEDFDKLYIQLGTSSTESDFKVIGTHIKKRIAILLLCHQERGKIPLLQYQEMYRRWKMLNDTLYANPFTALFQKHNRIS